LGLTRGLRLCPCEARALCLSLTGSKAWSLGLSLSLCLSGIWSTSLGLGRVGGACLSRCSGRGLGCRGSKSLGGCGCLCGGRRLGYRLCDWRCLGYRLCDWRCSGGSRSFSWGLCLSLCWGMAWSLSLC
jgi:hypothetical protein